MMGVSILMTCLPAASSASLMPSSSARCPVKGAIMASMPQSR